jgi:hypothetical protein
MTMQEAFDALWVMQGNWSAKEEPHLAIHRILRYFKEHGYVCDDPGCVRCCGGGAYPHQLLENQGKPG